LESEKRRSHFKPVNLEFILQDAIDFYEPVAEEKSIKILSFLSPLTINGDRDLLFQAFANILDNAVKYAPDHNDIEIRADKNGPQIIITITNFGSFLPEDDLDRIFERFYRSDSSRSGPGTGLGLSLSAAIIELHSGRIRAENTAQGLSIITVL
jgi:signal transduction histidine kinase